MSGGNRHRRRPPPRREPERPEPPVRGPVEVTVERVGAKGDGLASSHGARLYVPQSLAGDRLMVNFGQPRADGWEGEPVTLLEEAPGRAEPPCVHFGVCGGCAVQHMDDATYAAWKTDLLVHTLDRADLMAGVELRPMVRTPPGGRRRATMLASRRGRRLWLGYNERASHRQIDVAMCPILAPALVALVAPLRELLAGLLADGRQLDVALTLFEDGAEVLLVGLDAPKLPQLETLAAFAEANDLARLSWSAGPGQPAEPIARRRPGLVTFGNVPVVPAPGAFLQASREGEAALVAAALEGTAGAAAVADLFAGSGTLTFPLAERSRVLAVEGDADPLAALEAGARRLPAGQVRVQRRDLFRDPLTAPELADFQAVVFDPPRAGAAAQAQELAKSAVPAVVAVSCNPASFARDARTLVEGGYRLLQVTPVDQFLWSPHLELTALFRR